MAKQITIVTVNSRTGTRRPHTHESIEAAVKYYAYTLEKGASWSHEKGNSKINQNPKSAKTLVSNLNKAENNAAANGYSMTSYELG